jgi:hypothetical protein
VASQPAALPSLRSACDRHEIFEPEGKPWSLKRSLRSACAAGEADSSASHLAQFCIIGRSCSYGEVPGPDQRARWTIQNSNEPTNFPPQ